MKFILEISPYEENEHLYEDENGKVNADALSYALHWIASDIAISGVTGDIGVLRADQSPENVGSYCMVRADDGV